MRHTAWRDHSFLQPAAKPFSPHQLSDQPTSDDALEEIRIEQVQVRGWVMPKEVSFVEDGETHQVERASCLLLDTSCGLSLAAVAVWRHTSPEAGGIGGFARGLRGG